MSAAAGGSALRADAARDWILTAGLLLVALAFVAVMPAPRVAPRLHLQFTRNAIPIDRLEQPRQPAATSDCWVDVLDLGVDQRFAHPRLGHLGFGEHFFMDLETRFTTSAAGDYVFEVASDDGFALHVDGRLVCGHSGARALAAQACKLPLPAGSHLLQLAYYQGAGPAGLSVRYGRVGQPLRFVGEGSAELEWQTEDL